MKHIGEGACSAEGEPLPYRELLGWIAVTLFPRSRGSGFKT